MAQTEFEGVVLKSLKPHTDPRGWLIELFRDDELPEGFEPTMGYVSTTRPGVARGPHEHSDQTDLFVFLSGAFELHLWENRPGLPERHEVHRVGVDDPTFVTVPPGVVHAYRNAGDADAFVLNFPNRLYAGWGRKEPVDEIRHEDIDSRFKL
ncbi:MAG: dTDP-4-dehydrorhamnose 3,5-epimerase family protein [Fimbriimonas ginsengisoli]|uniref:dTDP-4-dehydrorhamnose 3,5-epimerase family protein n=1 Tax=Fimbriimonas ginsengisoli TaxID=1005039 RepID=A0A931PST9_FIMGI|nr:dTDP-4-dehydrorhamnose 3,5-epimerase family protein [Fimbriimonas ginsengisoli]